MNKIGMKYLCPCGYVTLKYFSIQEWFPTYILCGLCGRNSEVVQEHKKFVDQQVDADNKKSYSHKR